MKPQQSQEVICGRYKNAGACGGGDGPPRRARCSQPTRERFAPWYCAYSCTYNGKQKTVRLPPNPTPGGAGNRCAEPLVVERRINTRGWL
jgi:hypothetical protein